MVSNVRVEKSVTEAEKNCCHEMRWNISTYKTAFSSEEKRQLFMGGSWETRIAAHLSATSVELVIENNMSCCFAAALRRRCVLAKIHS